ncbi:TIGR00266 family protein [Cohnella fermenti]|uniref:TIGR00266 family protein n=1 Tax=Cohnella fermenti TaxID=2565925 RepID=A0A4S4C346_9BACL|nr:TIGR00266 family protein [Cohnella fermenti]THF82145.1 TIGR00266 family protein [Cohnella fermenti]
MKHEIMYGHSFPLVKVQLDSGESLKAEMNAMVSMSPSIDIRGTVDGGLLKGLGRMLSGEKFFFQELTAARGGGEVLLAPSTIGDVQAVELDGTYSLFVQKDGFLAGTSGIQVSTKMQNLRKGLFSGEGFFILEISGRGTVFISSFGAIHAINLAPHEEVIVDSQHLVAWPSYVEYNVQRAAQGWLNTFTSGEIMVCRFKGEGVVLIQSRNAHGFGGWLQQFFPKSR